MTRSTFGAIHRSLSPRSRSDYYLRRSATPRYYVAPNAAISVCGKWLLRVEISHDEARGDEQYVFSAICEVERRHCQNYHNHFLAETKPVIGPFRLEFAIARRLICGRVGEDDFSNLRLRNLVWESLAKGE
ncbi:hypothetical protein L596_006819 [Steinernema carpocapsae]|uniref:Uncharacterized protein n=1 Tax=Steinernema carpocapsae TaxID=34508 RepID=A0A4U5P826_STECR|nr:hypothetical protein L596_006819 [Steinernema carpocapsae]